MSTMRRRRQPASPTRRPRSGRASAPRAPGRSPGRTPRHGPPPGLAATLSSPAPARHVISSAYARRAFSTGADCSSARASDPAADVGAVQDAGRPARRRDPGADEPTARGNAPSATPPEPERGAGRRGAEAHVHRLEDLRPRARRARRWTPARRGAGTLVPRGRRARAAASTAIATNGSCMRPIEKAEKIAPGGSRLTMRDQCRRCRRTRRTGCPCRAGSAPVRRRARPRIALHHDEAAVSNTSSSGRTPSSRTCRAIAPSISGVLTMT